MYSPVIYFSFENLNALFKLYTLKKYLFKIYLNTNTCTSIKIKKLKICTYKKKKTKFKNTWKLFEYK